MRNIVKPFLMYYIGISGSGKTTIASLVEKKLCKNGIDRFQFIDGDVIRAQFGDIFGYTKEERMKCNQAVRVVVKYLLDSGVSVMLAQVGAYEEMRSKMRALAGDGYIEIFIKCSLEECRKRNPKGYYNKVDAGTLDNLNGANDEFEMPENSDIIIDTEQVNMDTAAECIVDYLVEQGYVV